MVLELVVEGLALPLAYAMERDSTGPGVTGRDTVGVFSWDLLWTRWARTR